MKISGEWPSSSPIIRRESAIEGHTDNVGGALYNHRLSQRRAEAVRQEIIDRFGAAGARLTAVATASTADREQLHGRRPRAESAGDGVLQRDKGRVRRRARCRARCSPRCRARRCPAAVPNAAPLRARRCPRKHVVVAGERFGASREGTMATPPVDEDQGSQSRARAVGHAGSRMVLVIPEPDQQ